MVYGEAGIQTPKLNLTFLCDNRFLSLIISINRIVHMESIFQADDRQARGGETNLPKDQEDGHIHVQLLLRRPGRSNGCRAQQVQRHVLWVWGDCEFVWKEYVPTLHCRSWEILRFNIWTIQRRSARASRACPATSPASASTRWWASPLRPCPPSRSTVGRFFSLSVFSKRHFASQVPEYAGGLRWQHLCCESSDDTGPGNTGDLQPSLAIPQIAQTRRNGQHC